MYDPTPASKTEEILGEICEACCKWTLIIVLPLALIGVIAALIADPHKAFARNRVTKSEQHQNPKT